MNDRIIEFDPLIEGVLIKRYKRFLADIKLESGEIVTAHCANTGPMKGLLTDGAKVRISVSPSLKRKLPFTLEQISVLNTPGTIDSDYRGEIKVILFNHGKNDFLINNKDRIAQMILTPVIKMDLEETDDLPETIRGEGGFGSTGK